MPTTTDGDIIEFGRFRLHRRDRTLLIDRRGAVGPRRDNLDVALPLIGV
jgi:hypothetical protein